MAEPKAMPKARGGHHDEKLVELIRGLEYQMHRMVHSHNQLSYKVQELIDAQKKAGGMTGEEEDEALAGLKSGTGKVEELGND